ncbi:MAG TPA: calcium-binding protein [Crinalium sp.]|jgi:Ca2+-binding RTX toxin-like protein
MATVTGTNGDDMGIFGGPALVGTDQDDTISGLAGRDALFGLGGNDTLDGGTGDDVMAGGSGDDTYIVDNIHDSVSELVDGSSFEDAGGIDTIKSSVSFNLSKFFENLTLTGTANINATGNGFGDNKLTGNSGNNSLLDGGGNDTLKGNGGNDILTAGVGNDTIDGGADNDTLSERGDVNFVLTDAKLTGLGIDTLTSIEAASLSSINSGTTIDASGFSGTTTLIGLGGVDTLIGGKNKDVFDSGSGNDILTGGAGTDEFLYTSISQFSSSGFGIDTIKDFNQDKIGLDKTTFAALKSGVGNGFSVAGEFAVVNSDAEAATSSALITYNKGTGHLFYNENGATAGFGTGAQFASLTNLATLSSANFVIQA